MKMEAGVVRQRSQVGGPGLVRRKTKKIRTRSPVSSSSISISKDDAKVKYLGLQRLYACCKNVFKDPALVPSAHDVLTLTNILDSMRPEDLGLSRELQFFKPGSRGSNIPRVTCTTVYECPKKKFSLVLFFLPASAVIPLHNHPEMTVFTKLLLGTMHIKSYDWADSVDVQVRHSDPPSSLRLARLKANRCFTAPCNTSVLYPTSGGNIHAFTAKTPCVVLDVIGPPYSKEDGRDCTYYKDIKYKSSDGQLEELKDKEQLYAWLKEVEVPEDSKMNCIEYLGPRVIETADS
ncbi:hypothetical protein vseg_016517 [Gypsophila vaccaria]